MNIKRITEFFVRQPMLFWSAVVAIVIGGILSFVGMPKLEDPAVAAKQASVVVVYPGATSQDEITNNMFKSGPLSGVTDDISLGWEEQYIYRVNGQRCIEAQCDPNATLFHGTVAKVESEVRDSINAIALPGDTSAYGPVRVRPPGRPPPS